MPFFETLDLMASLVRLPVLFSKIEWWTSAEWQNWNNWNLCFALMKWDGKLLSVWCQWGNCFPSTPSTSSICCCICIFSCIACCSCNLTWDIIIILQFCHVRSLLSIWYPKPVYYIFLCNFYLGYFTSRTIWHLFAYGYYCSLYCDWIRPFFSRMWDTTGRILC